MALAGIQWVVLKKLSFDNKSESALVVDMPAGTPVEETAAALHELGGLLAQQPDLPHLQGYAGSTGPLSFNGLLSQYALRAAAAQGKREWMQKHTPPGRAAPCPF